MQDVYIQYLPTCRRQNEIHQNGFRGDENEYFRDNHKIEFFSQLHTFFVVQGSKNNLNSNLV